MLWVVEKFKTTLVIHEAAWDLKVPIQVELEYALRGSDVPLSTISRKLRYNRTLLIKEAPSWSPNDLDRMVEDWVDEEIKRRLRKKGYNLSTEHTGQDTRNWRNGRDRG
jgi:hypothetical protein